MGQNIAALLGGLKPCSSLFWTLFLFDYIISAGSSLVEDLTLNSCPFSTAHLPHRAIL